MSRIWLNVADIRKKLKVDGPGRRSIVWTQGCTMGCPGCYNPQMHSHEPRKLLEPKQLARDLLAVKNTCGLTIMGGEPFQQAEACSVLAETYAASGKTVMVFSGYQFEQLNRSDDPHVQQFLKCIDILIAGPYVKSKQCNDHPWITSSNQSIHYFTEEGRIQGEETPQHQPTIEVLADGETLSMHGFPDQEDVDWFEQFSRRLEESMGQ